MNRKVTKHPGSKRPEQLSYRGPAIGVNTPRDMVPTRKHKGYHGKPGSIPPVYPTRGKKGAVWRAVTRPLRRLPGWQKRATSQGGEKLLSRIYKHDDDSDGD